MDFAKAVLTSPVLFVCVTQLYEHWVFSSINEAIESSIIQPDNPDIKGRNIDDEHRASTILGLRRESPPAVREFINKVLTAFGWGMPYADSGIDGQGDSQAPQPVRLTHLDRGVTTIESITPLVIPVLRTRAEHEHEDVTPGSLPTVLDGRNDTDRPTTPPTPRIFEFQDGDDPRIRITNRNDIVEMEVRLPPRVLSSHTELAETSTTESRLHQTAQTQNTSVPRNRPKHRVSQLSIESSRLLGTLVKGQCVSFALLPFKFVFLRLIASHYLGRSHELLHSRTVMPLPGLRDLTWGSVGTQISRVALCSALQVSIDLGLWGLQYFTAVRIGKGVFGWGTL